MKLLILSLITAASTMAFAEGGGDQPMTPESFIHESIEYSISLAKLSGASVVSVSTQAIDADTMNVVVLTADCTDLTYQCSLVDDFSKGGTVVQKDVRCSAL
jgi:hypothetical protein